MPQMCVELLNSYDSHGAATIWLLRGTSIDASLLVKTKNLSSSQHLWISSLVVESFNGTIRWSDAQGRRCTIFKNINPQTTFPFISRSFLTLEMPSKAMPWASKLYGLKLRVEDDILFLPHHPFRKRTLNHPPQTYLCSRIMDISGPWHSFSDGSSSSWYWLTFRATELKNFRRHRDKVGLWANPGKY